MMRKTAAGLLTIILAMITAAGTYALGKPEVSLESDSFFALGTTCNISIYGGTEEQFDEIEQIVTGIENRMSVNIAGSEISVVNGAAGIKPVEVSPDVYKVISEGVRFSTLSGGAFDISIGPLVQLWDIGGSAADVPQEDSITRTLERVDYRKIELLPQSKTGGDSIFLTEAGMALEPGGIAKGWAADAAAERLRKNGVESALINFGGNVLTLGSKLDGSAWRIGIQNPDSSRGDYIGIISVTDKAVVTSGKYERFFIGSDGRRYHHILSTADGYPVENGIAQVSIIATASITADAMSTVVFSLGLEDGFDLVESLEGVETIIVMENSDVYLSSGLVESFKLTDSAYRIALNPLNG